MTQPHLPSLEPPEPPHLHLRWVRLTATIDDGGRVAIAEVQVMGRSAESILYKALSPAPDGQGSSDAVAEVLECAKRLTMRS